MGKEEKRRGKGQGLIDDKQVSKEEKQKQILKEQKQELRTLTTKYDKLMSTKKFGELTGEDFKVLDEYILKSFDMSRTEELEGISVLQSSKKSAQFFKSFYLITKKKKWLNIKDCREMFEKISGRKLSENWVYIRMRDFADANLILRRKEKRQLLFGPHNEIVDESAVLRMYLNEVRKILNG